MATGKEVKAMEIVKALADGGLVQEGKLVNTLRVVLDGLDEEQYGERNDNSEVEGTKQREVPVESTESDGDNPHQGMCDFIGKHHESCRPEPKPKATKRIIKYPGTEKPRVLGGKSNARMPKQTIPFEAWKHRQHYGSWRLFEDFKNALEGDYSDLHMTFWSSRVGIARLDTDGRCVQVCQVMGDRLRGFIDVLMPKSLVSDVLPMDWDHFGDQTNFGELAVRVRVEDEDGIDDVRIMFDSVYQRRHPA